MRTAALPLGLLLAFLAAPTGAETATPDSLKEAVDQGYKVVGVIGQGTNGQDHVVYLQKDNRLILCGFRVVLAQGGFHPEKSGQLGLCTGLN